MFSHLSCAKVKSRVGITDSPSTYQWFDVPEKAVEDAVPCKTLTSVNVSFGLFFVFLFFICLFVLTLQNGIVIYRVHG